MPSVHTLHAHLRACRYLPIGGLKDFNVESVKLAYGENADVIKNGQVSAVRCCQLCAWQGVCAQQAEQAWWRSAQGDASRSARSPVHLTCITVGQAMYVKSSFCIATVIRAVVLTRTVCEHLVRHEGSTASQPRTAHCVPRH